MVKLYWLVGLKSNDIDKYRSNKQNAIKELSENVKFRQHFTAEAQMLEDQDQLNPILNALENHTVLSLNLFDI